MATRKTTNGKSKKAGTPKKPSKKDQPTRPNAHPTGIGIGGRPSKLTPEVQEAFTTAISIGTPYALAARYAKISEEVVYHWMRLGRQEALRRDQDIDPDPTQEMFLTFLRAVEEAEADAGIAYQTVVNAAARIDPAWSWKMLRVRFPGGYMETDLNANVEIPRDLPNEYLDRIIAGENPLHVLSEYNAKTTRPSSPNSSGEGHDA